MKNDKLVLSVKKPTPTWATWAFRIVFVLTTAAVVWIAGTSRISKDMKIELMLDLKVLDLIVWGVGKGLGVKKDQFDTDNPNS